MAECFERGPLSFLCWEDAFPQLAWERRRKLNLQKASIPPSSEPVHVTTKIRQASNLAAGQQSGQGGSAFQRYSPSVSPVSERSYSTNASASNTSRRSPRSVTNMSSDSSINHSTASNTSRPSPRSVTNMSSDSSINYSTGSNRSSPRMVTCKGSVCSINDSASKTNSLSFKRKSDKDLNENTKKENSDPAIEQTQDNVSHYNNLGEYISQKYQRHEICDICFKLGDTLYPAHKLVLASQSTLFADVFERESFSNTPVAPKVIKVRGVSEEALVSFLDFLYTGKMDINSVCLSDVFKLAAVFKVDQIKRLCVRKVEQLKCQDLLQLLPTMAKLKESGICELIIRKITHNFLEVKEDPEFFNLDLDTLCMILASDNVNVRSEFEIFAAAVSWIQHHDFDQRIHHIEKLMNCVRFTLMTSQELFLCFKKFPVLKQNKNCVNMITTANWAKTSMELNEEDPLDVPVNKRDGLNTQQSVSDYVEAKSSTNEIEDVEVRITRMSQEMAEDFNSHAIIQSLGSKCMLPESRPKIQQYRNSRCGATEQGKVSGSGNNRSLKKRGRKIPKDSPIWQLQSMQF